MERIIPALLVMFGTLLIIVGGGSGGLLFAAGLFNKTMSEGDESSEFYSRTRSHKRYFRCWVAGLIGYVLFGVGIFITDRFDVMFILSYILLGVVGIWFTRRSRRIAMEKSQPKPYIEWNPSGHADDDDEFLKNIKKPK